MASRRTSLVPRTSYSPRIRRHHRRTSHKISLAVVGGFLPVALSVLKLRKQEEGDGTYGLKGAMKELVRDFTGFNVNNNQWNPTEAVPYLGAIIGGIIIHKTLGKMANRYIKNIPFIEI